MQECDNGRGAGFGLIVSAKGRFWHWGGDDGITEEMDTRVHSRFEGTRVNGAPALAIVQTSGAGNRGGTLRRDDVGHGRLVLVKVRVHGAGRHVNPHHPPPL